MYQVITIIDGNYAHLGFYENKEKANKIADYMDSKIKLNHTGEAFVMEIKKGE